MARPAAPRPDRFRSERRRKLGRAFVIALWLAALALLAAMWDRPSAAADLEAARFARCAGAVRVTCVVDGDTFWYRGAKIRLADINTPEVGRPACPREAALGKAASARLTELLNAGPFTLARWSEQPGRDRDRYGRLLRTASRGGESLGAVLVREGLAEGWEGRRGSWC